MNNKTSVTTNNSITMINDIFAFQLPGAIEAVKNKTVDLCVMHNKGMPDSLHSDKQYTDVLNEVYCFLDERIQALRNANIQQERIIIDPGFGFAKTVEQNVTLLKNISQFSNLNCLTSFLYNSLINLSTPVFSDKTLFFFT